MNRHSTRSPISEAKRNRLQELAAPLQVRFKNHNVLHAGAYLKASKKWILSIFGNVKNPENDFEISIDVKALATVSGQPMVSVKSWLIARRRELQHAEPGRHSSLGEAKDKYWMIGLVLPRGHRAR